MPLDRVAMDIEIAIVAPNQFPLQYNKYSAASVRKVNNDSEYGATWNMAAGVKEKNNPVMIAKLLLLPP
eukprot:CAMPEP_0175047976 /NCGR_PEP_ID=MMETSP0052_2-20121109/5910_1 /TAXON_ID=51329 ORGANISM="Polytomella parva, Strain SAG 63-3" /NCGR_SAMPLE_ID=MMETSP0052_2 /ASSEMBLY_ACC=CAM_ASM_000194 /LENGTH=68 /DNA_ID=CAMNT_0016311943 /DNA_START=815 /DNA_END=1021 /DNA_ORIENTATION=-